ncbi:MAG: glycosyl transferase family 2 [Gemmatimonadetes bacterium]|nr:glycosyl transferase family 2 [Gemmatimonadota bacterium]
MRALVSVVIPTHNRLHYLRQTLQSVIAQTHTFWEITCDRCRFDGSNRFGGGILRRREDSVYAAASLRRMCREKLGIENAQGEFTSFLDSHDMYTPEYIAKKVSYATQNPTAVPVGRGLSLRGPRQCRNTPSNVCPPIGNYEELAIFTAFQGDQQHFRKDGFTPQAWRIHENLREVEDREMLQRIALSRSHWIRARNASECSCSCGGTPRKGCAIRRR